MPVIDQTDTTQATTIKLPYLEPHKVFAYMNNIVKTPKSHLDFYWQWGKHFNCGWAKHGGPSVIPCGMHADEAKFRDGPPQEKILAITLNFCLFRPASVRLSRFLIFTIRSCYNLGPSTLYPLFWKLVESFHYAFVGKNPDGSQLCSDGSRFLITEMRGDLDWFKQCWQFEKRGWMAVDCCFFCDAKSKGQTNPYSECGVEAQWNETEFTEAWDWAAHVLPDRLCA